MNSTKEEKIKSKAKSYENIFSILCETLDFVEDEKNEFKNQLYAFCFLESESPRYIFDVCVDLAKIGLNKKQIQKVLVAMSEYRSRKDNDKF